MLLTTSFIEYQLVYKHGATILIMIHGRGKGSFTLERSFSEAAAVVRPRSGSKVVKHIFTVQPGKSG